MQALPLKFFVDRREFLAILRLVTRHRRGSSILMLEAQANMGKSFLLHKMQDICDAANFPCALIDLGNVKDEGLNCQTVVTKIQRDAYHADLDHVLAEFSWQPPLPSIDPSFLVTPPKEAVNGRDIVAVGATNGDTIVASTISGKGIAIGRGAMATVNEVLFFQSDAKIQEQCIRRVTTALIQALARLTAERPWVLLFDGYGAGIQSVEKWLFEQLLPPIAQGQVPNLLIVIAGQTTLPALRINQHKTLELRCRLEKFDHATVADYMQRRSANLSRIMEAVKWSANGVPGRLSFAVDILVAENRTEVFA